MFNHAPKNYQCPFCKMARGIEENLRPSKRIIYHDRFITAFISLHWWPNSKGHILIIPNKHIENIYSLPDSLSNKIHSFEKQAAIALKKVYHCDGVSTRQHNESAGNQDIWHYHLHVFPRYKNDNLYLLHNKSRMADKKNIISYADKLKKYFSKNGRNK